MKLLKVLGVIAAVGGAAAVAYKVVSDNQKPQPEELKPETNDEPIIIPAVEDIKADETHVDGVPQDAPLEPSTGELSEEEVAHVQEISAENLAAIQENVPETERPFQHTVQFSSQEDLEGFKTTVIDEGYVVTAGDNEFELYVLHISEANEATIMGKVYYLADKAKAYHGHYQGWIMK